MPCGTRQPVKDEKARHDGRPRVGVQFSRVYVVQALLAVLLPMAVLLIPLRLFSGMALLLLLMWQAPLFIVALREQGLVARCMLTLQLFLLFNVYLFAAGGALFLRQ